MFKEGAVKGTLLLFKKGRTYHPAFFYFNKEGNTEKPIDN